MRKIFLAFWLLFATTCGVVQCRDISFQALDNKVSVIFINGDRSDSLLVTFCLAAGSADEIGSNGVANLLGDVFLCNLKQVLSTDKKVSDPSAYCITDYDQSVFYLHGRVQDLEPILRHFGDQLANLSVNDDVITSCKEDIKSQIEKESSIDVLTLGNEARKSLYWHAKYGSSIRGTPEQLQSISPADIINFKNKFYTNNRLTIIISGSIERQMALNLITQHFARTATSETRRLQEPMRHNAVIRISKSSKQVNAITMRFYWKVPCYRTAPNDARECEIAINYLANKLDAVLKQCHDYVISSSIEYNLWNYDGGEACIVVTVRPDTDVELAETAVLSELRLTSQEITKEQADAIAKKIANESTLSNLDETSVVNWIASKLGSGNEFTFVKEYPVFIQKYNLDKINSHAMPLFRKDPCVISIIKPE